MTEVQEIVFNHTKRNMFQAINLDDIDMDIIVSRVKKMISKMNECNRQSQIIEEVYHLMQDNSIPSIYKATITFMVIDMARKTNQ